MITVVVVRGNSGEFVSASASGHAQMGKKGTDIVCASVTILLRTTLTVLSGSEDSSGSTGLIVNATTAGRGSLAFRVTAFLEEDIPFLKYAADFLLVGLNSLEGEYPEALVIKVLHNDLC